MTGFNADTSVTSVKTKKTNMTVWQELRRFGRAWPEVMVGFGLVLTVAWVAALVWLVTIAMV